MSARWGNEDFYFDEDDLDYANLELSDVESPEPTDAEMREFYAMFCSRCGDFGHTAETCQWEPEFDEFKAEYEWEY